MVAQRAGRDVRVRDAAELPIEATRLTLGKRLVALAELTLVLVLLPILVCLTTVLVAVALLVNIVCILVDHVPSFRRKLAAGQAVCITPRIEES